MTPRFSALPRRLRRDGRNPRRGQSHHRHRPEVEELERFVLLSFTVTDAGDALDKDNNPVHGTLRWAITQADKAGGGTINFQIPGAGVHTITPTSALPAISAPVTIDGYSEGTPNTLVNGDNAVLKVVLDGGAAGVNVSGLHITAGGCKVQGLVIDDWGGNGVWLDGAGDSTIQGNFIGLDESGASPRPNAYDGVHLTNSPYNTIGGSSPFARNVISGNGGTGVAAEGGGSSDNTIEGNYIGTAPTGRAALPNGYGGVAFSAGSGNTIGGNSTGEGNLIAGNVGAGVGLVGTQTTNNFVLGNFIGTDLTGMNGRGADGVSMGNTSGNTRFGPVYGYGVLVDNGASANHIGELLAGNVISNNVSIGVFIIGSTASGNLVQGNMIGTDAGGKDPLGNGLSGVTVAAPGTIVGGDIPYEGNVISGNGTAGLAIGGTDANGTVVQGNMIGTDKDGEFALKNTDMGVDISDGATNNTVGGTDAGAGNVISGNGWQGVNIRGQGTSGNKILGNMIGTDKGGTTATGTDGKPLGNGFSGVDINTSATNNTVGGTDAGAGHVISGNRWQGVYVGGQGTSGNKVLGNKIGTDKGGAYALGNGLSGVYDSDADHTTIGGTAANAGNVISGNSQSGIAVLGANARFVVIQGNRIGTNDAGTNATGTDGKALGNGFSGVYVGAGDGFSPPTAGSASLVTVGGAAAGAGNVISGNLQNGVAISGPGARLNTVAGNMIGADKSGARPLPNGGDGVQINLGANGNTVGGETAAELNVISGNLGDGVHLDGAKTESNNIQGNRIGTNLAGNAPLTATRFTGSRSPTGPSTTWSAGRIRRT